jgi:hypothetical protein
MAYDSLAKFASHQLSYLCYNSGSFPLSVSEACLRDVVAFSI